MTINQKEIVREIRIKLAEKENEGLIISKEIVEEILKEIEDLYEETH
jgi:predicted transcriptional regulator